MCAGRVDRGPGVRNQWVGGVVDSGTWVHRPKLTSLGQAKSRHGMQEQLSIVADVAQSLNWTGFVTSTSLYRCIHDDLAIHSYVLWFRDREWKISTGVLYKVWCSYNHCGPRKQSYKSGAFCAATYSLSLTRLAISIESNPSTFPVVHHVI